MATPSTNIIRLAESYEFRRRQAARYAPAGGAVLWRYGKGLHLVRSEVKPLTTAFCCDLVTVPRQECVVPMLPLFIEAVYGPETLEYLGHLSPGKCADAVCKAMRAEAVDYTPPRRRR